MADLSSKLRIYLKGSGASLTAKIIGKASGFASVWILNRILAKEAYGNYELAFTIVGLLLLVGSGGFNRAVMYRLSRLDSPPKELDGHEYAGAALGWSLISSFLVAGLVFVGAPHIEALAGNETLAFWVSLLSFLIPIRVARGVYQSWYEARQRIPEAVFMGRMFPKIGTVCFLGGVWIMWPTATGVVWAILLSELAPTLIWYIRTPINPLNIGGQLSKWDVWYSVKLALTRGLSKTQRKADILMVGFLAAAAATAEYVVAAKIALILLVVHNILNSILRPRLGRFLSNEGWKKALKEYDQSRSVSLLFALCGASFLALYGKSILGYFGEYSGAYSALMVLVAGYTVTTSFGMSGGYLNIAGYAGWTLSTTVLLLLFNVVLNYIFIPLYGAVGAAFATLVSYTTINILITIIVLYIDGMKIYSFKLAGIVTSALLIIGLLVYGCVGPNLAALALGMIVILLVYTKINTFYPIVDNLTTIDIN